MTQSTPANVADALVLDKTTNALQLTWPAWLLVALGVFGCAWLLPRWWNRVEPLVVQATYRIPYAINEDYWHFRRVANEAAENQRIIAIGDSVIWGEYVVPGETLTDRLNDAAGQWRFVNGGLNGLHPLAIEGLAADYLPHLDRQRVLLHCNLLWLSSPQRDLSEGEENAFNHPRLVPQWYPRIPAYHAELEDRLATSLDRHSQLRAWGQHLRIAYFNQQAFAAWTLEHPYDSPRRALQQQIAQPETIYRHRTVPWHQQGIRPAAMPWVELESSWQWQGFRRTVKLLRARKAQVFVLVGPFNEHLLPDANRQQYRELVRQAAQWLASAGVPSFVPEALPSDEYGDASHPLAAGYERLADMLQADKEFQAWSAPTASGSAGRIRPLAGTAAFPDEADVVR